ncbi:hypothetical protein AHMF7605_29025 [Adhaeribacter arboris]|uniref:Uncharacterized protein n=1 Tax=Adhaeribacter arboris TaxID=2072846 RepID=A0A2T2Y8W8_9BACT|nr:hypothetical protein [Adhaeribacter arboris]PSR51955.1 hypothetical protein AHMF7605_29025 [Adhaeribacter arboris]
MNPLFQTLVTGATYAGSFHHSSINYTLLLIAILPHLMGREQLAKKNQSSWLWTLLSSTLIQISLWFLVNAIGISLIWNALAGFNLLFFTRNNYLLAYLKRLFFLSGFTIIFMAIVYYLIIFPVITTIAHVIAILLGVGLYFLYRGR